MLSLPLGAQSLPSLVAEALRNNREILAAQKKLRSGAAAARAGRQFARSDALAGLYLERRPVAGGGHRHGGYQQRRRHVVAGSALPRQAETTRRNRPVAKPAPNFEQYRAVRLNVISRHRAGLARTAPRDGGDLVCPPQPGTAPPHPGDHRSSLLGGAAAQQDIFKAQTQFSIFETQLLRYRAGANRQGDRDQRPAQPRRPTPISICRRKSRPAPARHARPDAGGRPRQRSCACARAEAWCSAASSRPTWRARTTTPTIRSQAATSTRAACRPCGSSASTSSSPPGSGASSGPRSTSSISPPPRRATIMKPPVSTWMPASARTTRWPPPRAS